MPLVEKCRATTIMTLVGPHSSLRNLLTGLISALFLVLVPRIAAQTANIDPAHDHPAPGTKLTRFAEIDNGVYKGSEPRNDADYRFLQSKHIKYMIEIKFIPLLDRLEVNRARKYGILVIPVTLGASSFAPSEKHIRRILCLLSDKRLRPVYFHCTLGRDRTALIATLYEIYFLGLPPEKAFDEIKRFGFKESWTRSGLNNYLEKHVKSPWDDGKHTCKRLPLLSSQQPGGVPHQADDPAIVKDFENRVSQYLEFRKKNAGTSPRPTKSPEKLSKAEQEIAARSKSTRPEAKQGDIFTPQIALYFRHQIAVTMAGSQGQRIRASLRHAEPVKDIPLRVNQAYPDDLPLQSTPPSLLLNLPPLPNELQYRIVGLKLVLLDVVPKLVVDFIPDALPPIQD